MNGILSREGRFEVDLPSGRLSVTRRAPSTDRRAVLVIFSGFRVPNTVDLGGTSIQVVRNEVIWIHDAFGPNGTEGYYVASGGGFSPRRIIEEFFELLQSERAISKEQIIVAGFSKGGSAALYFALELGLGGCITGVPQFAIGSYVREHWPSVHQAMTDGDPDFSEALDRLLPDTVAAAAGSLVPVYLLTSFGDPQFETEIQPNLGVLDSLGCFHSVTVDSVFVQRHIDVTAYCVPVIQGLLLLLLDGLVPSLGTRTIGWQVDDRPRLTQKPIPEAWCIRFAIEDERIFPVLDTFVRGQEISQHGSWKRSLQIGGQQLRLGSEIHRELTKKYYAVDYVDYSAARSVSFRNEGIDIGNVPVGLHQIAVVLEPAAIVGERATVKVRSLHPQFDCGMSGRRVVRFFSDSTGASLDVRALEEIEVIAPSKWNRVDECSVVEDGSRLKLRGRLVGMGMTALEWGSLKYLALFDDGVTVRTVRLGMLHRPDSTVPASCSKAYYGDMALQGIDLTALPDGAYDVSVLVVSQSSIDSSGVIRRLVVSDGRGAFRQDSTESGAGGSDGAVAHGPSVRTLAVASTAFGPLPRPISVPCADYSDDRGNTISCPGGPLEGCTVTFRGYGASLVVHDQAHVTNVKVDFNGNGGVCRLGANKRRRSFSASIRVGQDSIVDIGANVSSTSPVIMSAVEGTSIRVGDDVMFATNNQIRTDDGHPIFDVRTGVRVNPAENIAIGSHVWMAWGATALGGAVIGDGSVAGAFSILTKRYPNNCVIVGSPGRVVRRDIAWERPHLGLAQPFYKPNAEVLGERSPFWALTQEL